MLLSPSKVSIRTNTVWTSILLHISFKFLHRSAQTEYYPSEKTLLTPPQNPSLHKILLLIS